MEPTSSLIEAPKLRCQACEGYLVPKIHTISEHQDRPSVMCGAKPGVCPQAGTCLACLALSRWFVRMDEDLDDDPSFNG